MVGAVAAGVRGIVAVCGGRCQCATCHCYVDPQWVERLPPAEAAERDLIDFAWEPRVNSRLACRLAVAPELDGLTLYVPSEQYA
jgi:2Fe-2S ferredoxin